MIKSEEKNHGTLPSEVSAIKKWYESSFPKKDSKKPSPIANSESPEQPDLSQFFSLDWELTSNYARLNDDVYEIPIDSASKIGLTLSTAPAEREFSKSSVLILKRGGTQKAYLMTIVGDPSYLKGDRSKLNENTYAKHAPDFSGMVYFTTPEGQFVNGWTYENGALKGQLQAGSNTSSNQTIQSVKTNLISYQVCTAWYQAIPDDEGDGYHWIFLDYTNCYTVTIYDSPPSSGGGSGGGSTGGGSSGGGGSTTNPPTNPPCPTQNPASVSGTTTTNGLKVNFVQPPDGGFPPPTGGGSPCATDTPPSGIFGINNSNAIVLKTKFNELLNYAKSIGLTVRPAYSGSVTINGVQYDGQITQILDNRGNVVANYFTPAAPSSLFQTNYQYNIGNGNPNGSMSDGSPSIPIFSNTSTYGTGVIYSPVGGGPTGGSSSSSAWPSSVRLNNPPPGTVISNITNYLKCFDRSKPALINIYVDQPTANSADTWSGLPTDPDVGHTFISIEQNGISRVLGFYPSSGVDPYLAPSAPAALVDDSGHPYDVRVTLNPITSTQLTNLLNYIINRPGTYDLNAYNCTDFAIVATAKAGLSLPDHAGSWPGGGGSNPGNLGQDIRAMANQGNTTIKKTSGFAISNTGTCN